ncbi:MAG: LPS assembly lipoprotein LptE [Planctomycetota bacterium]
MSHCPNAGMFFALLAFASCGYSVGTGLEDRGIRTIAFQVVGNDTFRQRFEVEISRFLSRELPTTTGLMFASERSADAVLQVSLIDERERTVVIGVPSPSTPGIDFPRVREGALEGAVRVRLVGRDGTVHIDQRILDRTEFRAPIGENLTSARQEMAEDLARKIAMALQTSIEPGRQ